jgi:hypothetical protein
MCPPTFAGGAVNPTNIFLWIDTMPHGGVGTSAYANPVWRHWKNYYRPAWPPIHSNVFARYERGVLQVQDSVDDVRNFTHSTKGMKLRQRRMSSWMERSARRKPLPQ